MEQAWQLRVVGAGELAGNSVPGFLLFVPAVLRRGRPGAKAREPDARGQDASHAPGRAEFRR